MEVIQAFAALSLCCGAALMLLPDGSVKRTAALAMGMMLSLLWLQGAADALSGLPKPGSGASVLEKSHAAPDAASALSRLSSLQVMQEGGRYVVYLPEEGAETP